MNAPDRAAHTPGPWMWEGYTLKPEIPNPDGSAVHTILQAETMAWGYVMSNLDATCVESDANQRLIAAAPELLDALRIAEQFMAGFEDDDAQIGMGIQLAIIRAAIAKVELGGEP
ncbi:MAG: hypothetical protein WC100_00790 [Sterolibacterium sp.]